MKLKVLSIRARRAVETVSKLLILLVRKLRLTEGANLTAFPGLDPGIPFMINCDQERSLFRTLMLTPTHPSPRLISQCLLSTALTIKAKRKVKVRT